MNTFLLDTNQLSAAVFSKQPHVREAIASRLVGGHRVGTSVLALCELQPVLLARPNARIYQQVLAYLLGRVRIWPVESSTVIRYGELFNELRQRGRVLSFVDIVLAAMCREFGYTLVTDDQDFRAVHDIRTENWIVPPTSAQP